jgi:hypothetical protein
MFGLFRRKATTAAVEAVRPLIATLRVRGPIPSAALHDPYFLGFIAGISTFHALFVAKANTSDINFIVSDVLKEIGGAHHKTMVDVLTGYVNNRNPDYIRSRRHSDNLCGLTFGLQKTDTGGVAIVSRDPNAALLVTHNFIKYVNAKYCS